MVPMLSELWRLALFLLRPESSADPRPAQAASSAHGAVPASQAERASQANAGGRARADWAGLAKALLWACLSVLTGLSLAQLH